MELGIGEEMILENDNKIKCVDANWNICSSKCFFRKKDESVCKKIKCTFRERKDRISVYFEEVLQ